MVAQASNTVLDSIRRQARKLTKEQKLDIDNLMFLETQKIAKKVGVDHYAVLGHIINEAYDIL